MTEAVRSARALDSPCVETQPMASNCSISRVLGLAVVPFLLTPLWVYGQPLNPALQIQIGPNGKEDAQDEFNPVFLPAPRELTRLVTRAKRAIDERRYSDAVEMLGQLLQDDQAEDYFMGGPNAEGARASLKAESLRLLGSMPSAGRRSYELQFGNQAQRLLDHALETGSESELSRVSRQFFHTRAGYESTMLLGRLYLTQGRPWAAAAILHRLADTPAAAAAYEPDLSLLIATCWSLAGAEDSAIQRLQSLHQRQPNAKFMVGDTHYSLRDLIGTGNDSPALNQRLRKLLEQMLPERLSTSVATANQWLMFRGNPARNADTLGGWPLSSYRWRVMTTQGIKNPTADEMVRELRKQYNSEGRPCLPASQPLAVGDYILMRTPDRLFGVELQTGKSIWEYPAFGQTLSVGSGSGWEQEDPTGTDFMNQTRAFLQDRLWEDSRLGQMSSDGQRVFLIDQSRDDEKQQFRTAANNRLRGQVIFLNLRSGKRQTNHLVALDVQRQGAIAWSSRDNPQLADAFFLGAPLPLADQLFTTVELFGEIRLVVLRAETGEVLWSQQLAHIEPGQLALAGSISASPAFHDGVLVCSTAVGALVGVDLATRSLLWGYQYGQNMPLQRHPNLFLSGRFGLSSADQWTDNGLTLANDRVIFTPTGGSQLLCLDLRTGTCHWKVKKSNEMLYVAGVRQGVVVVVGKKTIHGYRLSDGKMAWPSPIKLPTPEAIPSGRGFFVANHYYLPTSAPELLEIDCVAGTIVKQAAVKQELGNLICYRQQVISLGSDQLLGFYQEEHLLAEVQRRLRDNPDDAWALEHYGIWLVDNGRQSEALAALRRAFDLYPPDEPRRIGTQALLVQTLLDALRDDFTTNRQLAQEVDGLIQKRKERERYLRLMADGLSDQQKWPDAFQAYLKLADFLAQQSSQPITSASVEQQIQLSRHHKVRYEQWIGQRLDEVLQECRSSERDAIDDEIERRLQQALDANTVSALRHFASLFPHQSQSDQARLALARRLIEEDKLAAGQMKLSQLKHHAQQEESAARATWELARSLVATGQVAAAANQYRWLARHWPDQPVANGKSGAELAAELAPNSPVARRIRGASTWPTGNVTSKKEKVEPQHNNITVPIPITETQGPFTPGTQIYTSRAGTDFAVFDAEGNETVQISVPPSENFFYFPIQYFAGAKTAGSVIVVTLGMDIIALDTSPGEKSAETRVLWQKNLRSSLPVTDELRTQFSVTTVNTPFGTTLRQARLQNRPVGQLGPVRANGVCFQKQRELHCVDLITGALNWSRSDVPAGSELLGNDRYVLAIPPKTNEGRAFSMTDGHELFRCKVPENRWKTSEGRILYWKERPFSSDKPVTLGLFDTETQKDVWKYDFSRHAQLELIADDELAVVERNGQLVILSLRNAQRRIQYKLARSTGPHSFNVVRTPDRYVIGIVTVHQGLAVDKPTQEDEREQDRAELDEMDPFDDTGESKDVQRKDLDKGVPRSPAVRERMEGLIVALSRDTGKPLWEQPVRMGQFTIPPYQPTECPALLVVHPVPTQPIPTGSPRLRRSNKNDLICIDRRNGRQLAKFESQPFNARPHVLRADVDKRQVTVQLTPQECVKLKFTDD